MVHFSSEFAFWMYCIVAVIALVMLYFLTDKRYLTWMNPTLRTVCAVAIGLTLGATAFMVIGRFLPGPTPTPHEGTVSTAPEG